MHPRWLRLQVWEAVRSAAVPLAVAASGVVLQYVAVFFMAVDDRVGLTCGDALLISMRGMDEFDAASGNVFLLDATWFLPQFALAFAACSVVASYKQGFEMQTIIRLGTPMLWLASKIAWCLVAVAGLCVVEVVGAIVCASVSSGALNLAFFQVSDVGMQLAGVGQRALDASSSAATLLLAALATFTLVLLSCVLAVVVGRVPSILITVVALLASAFFHTNYLPFDYAMLARSGTYAIGGFTAGEGFVVCGVLVLALVALGAYRSRRFDFL